MALSGWVHGAVGCGHAHFVGSAPAIAAKLEQGASFEKWMTWQLAQAFSGRPDERAFTEVGYSSFGVLSAGTGDPSDQTADLLIVHWPTQALIVAEAAIVLPATQKKWQHKIAVDYAKLAAIAPQANLAKLLMVYSLSDCEAVVGNPVWDDWFTGIRLLGGSPLPAEDFVGAFPIGSNGQGSLRVWQVP